MGAPPRFAWFQSLYIPTATITIDKTVNNKEIDRRTIRNDIFDKLREIYRIEMNVETILPTSNDPLVPAGTYEPMATPVH